MEYSLLLSGAKRRDPCFRLPHPKTADDVVKGEIMAFRGRRLWKHMSCCFFEGFFFSLESLESPNTSRLPPDLLVIYSLDKRHFRKRY